MARIVEGPDDVRTPRMQPISFAGCFGWFHAAPANLIASFGVVLCPGVKTDVLTGYRSFRQLAETLASAGFPTLRFHYPGTGDSYDPGDVEYWSLWQESIHQAADWLNQHSGNQCVVLCGLRIGATLAALVAEKRSDIGGLVLLEPIVAGRSFVRQLMIEENLRLGRLSVVNGVEAGGVRLSYDTVQTIEEVDLQKVRLPPKCRVASYSHGPSPALSKCLDAWSASGAAVTRKNFDGLEPMLRPTFMSHGAPAEVARIVGWLCSLGAGDPPPRQYQTDVSPSSDIMGSEWVETPLQFGVGRALFGILCRPTGYADGDLAVIIDNTSGDPHCAPVAVVVARRLASKGVASLRMDFAGLGDSISPGDVETHVLETDRRADIATAIGSLTELGFRRFAIQGLCSGAYHAFHAAVADPRVSALVLVNLPQFQWEADREIESEVFSLQSPLDMLRKLRSKHAWNVLFQQGLNLRNRLVGQAMWLARKVGSLSPWTARFYTPTLDPSSVRQSIYQLSQRTRILLLYSGEDPGIDILAQTFESLQVPPNVTVKILPEIDHSLTTMGMRRLITDHTIEFLRTDPGTR